MNELVATGARAGIPIKKEEFWISTLIFEFSRKYFFCGAQMSGALKRISRVASEANQTIQTLNGDISGIFSLCTAAAAEDKTPIPSYITTVFEAILRITQSFPWMHTVPLEQAAMSVCVSRILGGLPISLFSQFCTRAVQDPLSSNISLLKTIANTQGSNCYVMTWATLDRKQNPKFESLVKDPCSLPLFLPQQPEALIREVIEQGLTG